MKSTSLKKCACADEIQGLMKTKNLEPVNSTSRQGARVACHYEYPRDFGPRIADTSFRYQPAPQTPQQVKRQLSYFLTQLSIKDEARSALTSMQEFSTRRAIRNPAKIKVVKRMRVHIWRTCPSSKLPRRTKLAWWHRYRVTQPCYVLHSCRTSTLEAPGRSNVSSVQITAQM